MRSGAERTRQTGLWKRWLAVILAAVVTAGAVPVNFLGVKAAEGTPVVTDAAQETERISEETQVEVEAAEAEVHGSEKTDSDEPDSDEPDSEEPDLETAASDIAASDNTDPGTAEDLPASEVDGGEADNKESEAPAQSAEKEHKEAAQAEEDMSAAETAEGAAEEPADGEGNPEQDEVRSISIEEVDPVAVSISDAFKEELSTADGETFYFKHTPDLFSGRRFFRTYATQNASVMAYAYDQGGNLVAEAESIGEKEVTLSFSVSNRNTYYIQVELKAENPEEGPGTSKILFATSESYGFSCQPVGDTLRTGLVNSQMTLSVKASAMTELSYQWVIENETIEGETSDSYTFTVGQGYMYLCLVTDELGHTYRCRFQVRADNQLSVYPESGEPGDTTADIHVEPGEEAQLKVVASAIDETGISYEWERYITRQTPMGTLVGRREHINGADGDTLTLESPQTGGIFYCTVRDMYSSREIRFNTYVDNELTAYIGEAGSTSAGVTAAPGEAVAFDVFATAKDSSQLTYMWYKESDLLAQTQEGAYEITSPMSASYSCTVSDQYGNSKKIMLKVLVENELTVYAGATQDTQDDVYVFEGDPAVLPVDVSAIDEEGMTYVWQKRVLRSGGEYTWTKISAAAGPEYTAETFEDEDQFRCEVTDRFGNSAVITFTVHVLEDAHYLAVRLLDPAGNVLTDGFTVSWYAEDGTVQGTGKKIHSVSANTQYECRISLGEDLGCRYVQPEPAFYNSGENSETFDLSLVEYGVVKVTGIVTDKTGEAVAGASVKLKQIFNGEFTRILEAETDASGAFALDARKTRSNLIVSADGYFDGYYAIPAETEEDVSVEVVLEKIPANRITLKLFRRDAAPDGEEQVTTELTSANGLEISARNVTKAAEITDLKFQFPYVVLGEGAAEPGDSILLSAQCDKAGMTADQIEVTLDNMSCAEAEWTFVQNGKIRIKDITGNDENVVMVFDADGQCVQSGIASAAFTGSPLPEGKYSCVLMKKTDALRSVDIFGRLAEFGLAEGTDYVKLEAEVHKGIITEITGVKVPALHMDGLVYTVEENTRFWANRMENVTGQYVQMRLSYEIDEEYASAEETVTIEVPEGMTFVERSLTLDGRACECRVEEHDGAQTVTIPAGRKSILRFYVLPTASGDKNVFANLSFSEGGETVRQPLGALTIGVSAASIIVPDKTGQKTVTVTGQAIADCEITVYDNDTAVGTTTSKKSGTWALTFDLVDPRKYSNHRIFATVKSEEFGVDIETDAAELFYNCNYVELSKVTMINTAHPAGNLKPTEFRTVFDFLHPSTAIPFYRYWPKYPAFTFVVEFTKDSADAVSDVCVITTNSAGDKTRIACEYDEEDGVWVGTHNYPSASDTPCKVGVSCNNDSDSIYDFSIDGEEMEDPEYHKASDLEALIDETAEIENEEYTDGKLSYDVIVKGRKIGRYSLEIYDYHTFDVDDWKNGHEAVTFAEEGNTCFSSFESSGNTITSYVIDPYKELAVCASFEAASGFDAAARSVSGSREVKKTSSAQDTIFGMLLKWIGAEQALEETFKFPYYYIEKDALEHEVDIINNFCTCAVGKDLNAETVLNANLELSLFKTNFWSPIAIGIIIDQILIIGSDAINTDFFNLGPDIETVVASLMSGKESVYKNEYQRRLENIKGYQKKLKKCHICDDSSSTWCNCRNHELTRDTNQIIDPSGYVYEAVPSNRVSGVKAEAYYYDYAVDEFGVQEDEKSEILWDAENYDQVNPQYTDADGTFGWDVPEGQWLVKFSKEGYEDTDSRQDVAADEDGYLPVPPIQTEVNTAIVSKAAPEVSTVEAYPDEIRIEFSQYMQIGSVSAANVGVTSGGKTVPGTIKALNAEENYEKTDQFASYFAFVPDKELSGTVKVNVSSVKNYCGKAMAGSYSKDHDVKIMPKGLEIIGSRNILYRGSEELTIRVVPAEAGAGRTITVASYSPSIVAAQEQKITADRNGTAKVVLSGNLPGQGILSVSLDGTRISEEITATVSMTQSSVSLEEGGYSVKLAEDAVPYSGRPITPAVTVDGLTEGTDFSVSYKNNTDPGTATVTVTGMGSYTGTITGTFLILPGKTSRGDMFNLANNVKVTWTEVPGANYYKVYREGITDKKESLTEPVIVTTGLVGWDSQAGLTNGHAYRYKIVASLTGKGDPSGDSRLSYSKMMYRLKTTAWKYVKNTAPGKVTASYQKSASGDSYVILYADNEDMTGAKSKVIFGADTTSAVLGGFRKGKTYWFQIRVRKKVNGIDYYTTFGVKKPVRITR